MFGHFLCLFIMFFFFFLIGSAGKSQNIVFIIIWPRPQHMEVPWPVTNLHHSYNLSRSSDNADP